MPRRFYTIAKCKHLKVLDFRKIKLKVRCSTSDDRRPKIVCLDSHGKQEWHG